MIEAGYMVVIEQTPNNYCAYLPDFPGCVSAAQTWREIQEMVGRPWSFILKV